MSLSLYTGPILKLELLTQVQYKLGFRSGFQIHSDLGETIALQKMQQRA